MLVKPQTFMNLSGESVFRILQYYHIPLDHLIVIYDDIDTAFGRIRVRKKGSAGTHNGMRHILYMIQDENFPRIRIGIGESSNRDLKDFVLQRFTKDEMPIITDAIERAASAAETIIERGTDAAMNAFNGTSQ
jgi:PTH1 family peptidyl-tRNA hydrolase